MTIDEYCRRVRKLRVALQDLEADFNDDEGLTLVASIEGRRIVYTGETDIVEKMEADARAWLARVAASLGQASD